MSLRPDQSVVAGMVPEGSHVLDLGCGDGGLLEHLLGQRGCSGYGVELSDAGFHACIDRGVPVQQGDIERGLPSLERAAFDVVVVSQTLQATRHPAMVLEEIVRVGRRAVVSFPNFAHWRLRLQLLARGRMPESRVLPYAWHDTPNIHLCTIVDFERLAQQLSVRVVRRVVLDDAGAAAGGVVAVRPNLLAAGAAYLLERR